MISGFLISGIILRGLATARFSFLEFYARRVKRIFPALIVVLLATSTLGWLTLLPDEYELLGIHTAAGAGFALNLVLFANLNWYFDAATIPLLHLWSLGVEEQFYFLWPLFLVSIWKLGKQRLALITTTASVSFALNVWLVTRYPLASFYLPTSRLWELAMGAALAYTQIVPMTARQSLISRLPKLALLNRGFNHHTRGALGASLLIASYAGIKGQYSFPGWWALLPTAGALLLISAGTQSFVSRLVLTRRPMVLIGLISYPLYLWHYPLLTFSRVITSGNPSPLLTACVVMSSFALASLTYIYVERPLRFAPKLHVAVPLFAAVAACGALGYLNFAQVIPSRPTGNAVKPFISAATEEFPPNTKGWLRRNDFIVLGKGSRSVMFVGDSNMFQYYSRIEHLLASHPANSHRAIFAASAGCSLVQIALDADPDSECSAYIHKAVEYAKGSDADTVVIGATWYGYLAMPSDEEHYGDPAPLRPETEHIFSGLQRTISDLVRAGKRVYIVLQTPIGVSMDPRHMIRRSILPPGFSILVDPPTRDRVATAIGPIDTKLRALANEAGARVIDPVDSLCNEKTCPTVSSTGDPMYWDANHLRPSYVRDHVRYLDKTLLDPNTEPGAGQTAAASTRGTRSPDVTLPSERQAVDH